MNIYICKESSANHFLRWVDQCTNGHDKNRRTEEFSHVGQNWAWQGSWKIDDQAELASIMVERWYDEVYEKS